MEDKTIATYQSRDGQEIKLSFDVVRKYLVSGKPQFVTDQEIMLYVGTCKARGLNPFKKDCYLVKYTENDAAAIIVSIDYYRSRARAQPDCRGWQSGIIVETKEGEVEKRNGSFMTEDEILLGGWFRGKPDGWHDDYEWTVSLKPFVKTTRDGQPTRFWSVENQPAQIAKVAESQGLRRLWPDEFQDLRIAGDEIAIDVMPEHEEKQKVRAPGTANSYKSELMDAISQYAKDSNAAKAILKELTGKLFITNVSETEAKEALVAFNTKYLAAGFDGEKGAEANAGV